MSNCAAPLNRSKLVSSVSACPAASSTKKPSVTWYANRAPRDGVDAEILDADLAGEDADLEVLGVDLRRLDLAPLDVRLDDGRLTGVVGAHRVDRGRSP